ncbi:MAG TPA: hypothetical protein VIV60_23645 [Polyangiaceae bacterium]
MSKTIAVASNQHWLAVGEGTNSDSQLSLVGIGDDHRVSVYPLPPWDTQLVATAPAPSFSESGDRLCYTSVNAGVTRVFTVALSERTAVVQETQLPTGLSLAGYDCSGWLSPTMFVMRVPYTPEAIPDTARPPTLFLSTDPTEPLPPSDAPLGGRSPDGHWAIESRPSDPLGNRVLYLWSISPRGIPEREVMSLASGRYTWSPNSQRLAVITEQDSGTRLTVYELSLQGQWEVLDTRSSGVILYAFAGFSPDSRYLALTGIYSLSAMPEPPPVDPDWGGNVFVRDVENHTEFDTGTNHSMKWDSSGHLIEVSGNVDPTTSLLEHCPGLDAFSTFFVCGSPADSTFVVVRQSDGATALDFLDCSASTVRTTHLVPGIAGDGEVIAEYCRPTERVRQTEYLLVGNPSYFYFTFDGPKLRHALRLTDFFGQDYAAVTSPPSGVGQDSFTTISPPDGIGLLARSVKKDDYAWLYLDQAQPGPMVSFPRRINNPSFYLPQAWLKP